MRVVNNSIPRDDRAEVQMHLGALNAILPNPDLNQMEVVVGADGSYTLDEPAKARVTAKLDWLVSHQTALASASHPSLAPTVQKACSFFGIDLPDAPTGTPDVEGGAITPGDKVG